MKFYATRFLQLIVVVVIATFLTLVFLNQLDGDPCIVSLGTSATEENVALCREENGFDQNIFVRYVIWAGNMLSGDFGESFINGVSVADSLKDKLPVTLSLLIWAQTLSLVVAIPLGVYSAYRADSRADRIINTTAYGLLAVPNFVLGLVLVLLFAVTWELLPAIGYTSIFDNPIEHVKSMLLPAIALAAGQIAVYMRLLRTDMMATLQEDFITLAKAKGMSDRRILFRHALRPSSFALITIAGINIANLIGGSLIIERIFALNGVGSYLIESVIAREYLVVQSLVALIAVAFVTINFVVDMLYAALDPRIRHARSA